MMLLSSCPSLFLSRFRPLFSMYNKTERQRVRDSSSSYEMFSNYVREVADQLEPRR